MVDFIFVPVSIRLPEQSITIGETLKLHAIKGLGSWYSSKNSQILKLLDKSNISLNKRKVKNIIKMIWFYVLIGLAVGAIAHGFIPNEIIERAIQSTGIFAVPLVVLIGIPLYANCAAIIPVAVVLFEKGVPIGTALAFMMATAALSLPEAIILKRVMKTKLIVIFFGIVGISIIVIGYLFNFLFRVL